MADPSKNLSVIKVLSLLLHELSRVGWMTQLEEFDHTAAPFQFAGPEDEFEEVRKDIAGGGGTFLAYQFVILVINWFEQARTDRVQEFVFRMTLDLEHDILVFLTSEECQPTSIYLILKALYARDPTPDASSN